MCVDKHVIIALHKEDKRIDSDKDPVLGPIWKKNANEEDRGADLLGF